MVEVQNTQDVYTAEFQRREKDFSSGGGAWLLPIRKAAMARFAELGFPTKRHENWLYTNVAPIAQTAFQPAEDRDAEVIASEVAEHVFDSDCCRLVFVNGRFSSRHSAVQGLPEGVKVCSLAAAMRTDSKRLEPHLARHANDQDNAFAALNTALMTDGAFVHIPKGVVVERPIHLLFLAVGGEQPEVTHPRNLIVAETNSQATIVETYAGVGGGEAYLTNAVTEVVANENATLVLYKIERECEQAFHVATTHFHQYRSSNVSFLNVLLGGILVRNDIYAMLDGEGCDCSLNGLSMLSGTQHADNHLWVHHAKPHCNSREYFKGIYDDQSHGVFCGRIFVEEGAQKTDAKQTNMNLILSDQALADSKPQLEIFADDVKCTHGATIGQIDNDAIFYLGSRGLSKEAARSMLIYAFANEMISQISIEPLRARLSELLFDRLPQTEMLRETV